MYKRIRNKLLGQQYDVAYNFEAILHQVSEIAKVSRDIALAPQVTSGSWIGINVATRQLFAGCFLEIPQYYSNQVLSDKELEALCNEIARHKFRNVVISGFPPYFEKIITLLGRHKHLSLSVFLHGTFSEFGYGEKSIDAVSVPARLLRENKIQKIAAVRKDVALFLKEKWGVEAFHVIYKCLVTERIAPLAKTPNAIRNIGVFGLPDFNKNVHNQVCGASMVKNAKVFVGNADFFSYLNEKNIEGIGRLSHDKFVEKIAAMDINLHLSFSESWGQVAVESMALGVPCLVSPGTNILDDDEFLRNKLTVSRIDSPVHIAERIEEVLAESETLGLRCAEYAKQLNQKADLLLQQFLE